MRNGTRSRGDSTRRPPQEAAPGLFAERRTARPRALDVGETVVRTVGIGLAVASTAFAGYMISDVERQPQFAGLEHLAIYSRPAAIAARRTQTADARSKVDFTPVGSIAESQPHEAVIPGFRLIEMRGGAALLETPNAIVRVSPGDIVVGLGRITAFERRGDKWVAVTPSGIVVGN